MVCLGEAGALEARRRKQDMTVMSRHGSLILSDVLGPTLTIVCEPCGRRGRYPVERLISRHGSSMKLTDLLSTLADCPKARSRSIHDRFKAVYEGLRWV